MAEFGDVMQLMVESLAARVGGNYKNSLIIPVFCCMAFAVESCRAASNNLLKLLKILTQNRCPTSGFLFLFYGVSMGDKQAKFWLLCAP